MQTILLTSTGTEIQEEILKILPKPASKMTLAHITTASKVEPDTTYVESDHAELEKMGFKVTDIDIKNCTETELINILDGFDIIYVQGGNTFYLLQAVKESGFNRVIKKLIDNGVIYIGVSAGSLICGPTIETASWQGTWPDKNIVKLKNLKGLNLVPFNLCVHYDPQWQKTVKAELAKSKIKTRILTDQQGFLVKNNEVELVGQKPEIVLN